MRTVAIYGLGGVGKTQIGLEYAHRYRSLYQACFWITCDTVVKTTQGIVEIARLLDLQGFDLVQTHALAAVKNWLCTCDEKWLVIFDNAGNPDDIAELWPSSSEGSILLTSQNSHWKVQENLGFALRVNSLSPSDGATMLHNIMIKQGKTITLESAAAIVNEVDELPLAIRQIGSYMSTTNMEPQIFLDNYQYRRTASHVDAWDESCPPSYTLTLATLSDPFRSQSMLAPDGTPSTMTEEIQLANAYNNLAGIYCAQERYSDAELHNRLSLAMKKRWEHRGGLEYLLSLSYTNLAIVHGQQRNYDEAAKDFEKALAIGDGIAYTPRRALLDLLFEALRVLKTTSRDSSADRCRIARTKFKLSLVLRDLGDPRAPVFKKEAQELKLREAGSASDPELEESYDALVAYI
ncbi:uncharacterized protein MYCFIDRAFT_76918 [Pseudocercospora fijiensis CIRAD86]|uniref:Uncharacterized protein n=1 Tax=Pseudocercospora fijiensis (strain CIRAD86) TaxID=383855 RepID=M3AU03_PSEFD|nr:uncharacterized protein MYCFIDRAFT_76918 [Pseudocercospora fijiensis CIRAD86]EME80972.1 hypothetical protein MYCFIDRAFT_76918 [Pseudocercospora fijiensis CIRAD86]